MWRLAVSVVVLADAHTDTLAGLCSSTGCASGNSLLQHSSTKSRTGAFDMEDLNMNAHSSTTCDEARWPDKDHNLVCGECKVLVDRFSSYYKTCDNYCSTIGRSCVGAWEELNDDCSVAHDLRCDQTIASSDAICQCGSELDCYGELAEMAADEGNGIGVDTISTNSVDACKEACDGNDQCKSFSYCGQWGKCWLKDRSFNGGEQTKSVGACKTYFKRSSCASGVPEAESEPEEESEPESESEPEAESEPEVEPKAGSDSATPTIKVISYNLFWWNAFDQNAWKSDHIVDNIKDTLQADSLGLQECDEPETISSRTSYLPASPFKGAQGVMVKPNLFQVVQSGSQDIQAAGKWGARYVTWAELTHSPSGRTFWHFNTHWCVHNGNGRTCNSDTRNIGAQNMLNVIREKAGDAPVVITGDFNAAMTEAGPQQFTNNGFTLAKSNWVDAVFYSTAHWQVLSTATGDYAHSDHKPIIAELLLV